VAWASRSREQDLVADTLRDVGRVTVTLERDGVIETWVSPPARWWRELIHIRTVSFRKFLPSAEKDKKALSIRRYGEALS
jgi:hypothetical protein